MEDITHRPDIHNYRGSQTPTHSYDDSSDKNTEVDTSQELRDSQVLYQNESYTTEKNPQKNSIGVLSIGVLSIGVLSIGVIVIPLLLNLGYKRAEGNQKLKSCSFSELEKKYHQNEDAWYSLRIGIENIINGITEAPAVYLLLHNDRMPFYNITLDIAQKASSCFDNGNKPVEMDSADFTSEKTSKDYGYVIDKYKKKIKEGDVIFIVNLNKIPAKAAQALHSICDTINPIVKNVVILLTLNSQGSSDKAIVAAEDTINELWGPILERSSLDPIITRITDQVIALK